MQYTQRQTLAASPSFGQAPAPTQYLQSDAMDEPAQPRVSDALLKAFDQELTILTNLVLQLEDFCERVVGATPRSESKSGSSTCPSLRGQLETRIGVFASFNIRLREAVEKAQSFA